MAAEYSGNKTPNTHLLQELEALSQTLYQTPTTNRRTNSLVLPRSSVPPIPIDDVPLLAKPAEDKLIINPKPRQRRMSLSPWRSRPKLDNEDNDNEERSKAPRQRPVKKLDVDTAAAATSSSSDKKGLWNWKPIRALSHIGMQKLSCLFSIEVVAVQGLPASMNGLRLSVCVRKKETKDGAVHTMPSRVSQGAADFEEILFIRCHLYCSSTTSGTTTQLKFEPRPFVFYVFAVDAEELDFGRSSVDLSHLIQESVDKNSQGTRVKQWDTSFNLSGKAKGGELVLKLGFQLMEKEGGFGLFNQADQGQKSKGKTLTSSNFARKQSKSSFSIASPRMSSRAEAWTPSQSGIAADLQGIDELDLDEPTTVPLISSSSSSVQIQKKPEEPEPKMEDQELPEFDIVDKGVEMSQLDKTDHQTDEDQSEENSDIRSVSSEVVKEVVVHDQVHLKRLTELDAIARQIKTLESMMGNEKPVKTGEEEAPSPKLEADEETVTREFLQMLEGEEAHDEFYKGLNHRDVSPLMKFEGGGGAAEEYSTEKVFIPDLGKGLGCVVQTRDGGYLAAMNPLDTEVARKDTPKLAMQISKPLVLPISDLTSSGGFEVFQRMAASGMEELSSEILSLMPVDELMGKTAEQIAFEGIASAIIQGRNKLEGANSSAARTIAAVKTMVAAMSTGRNERISSGIWNMISENPLSADEILAFSMQKIEDMAVEALKIQAEMTEEDAPFVVSPINGNKVLSSAVPLEDWIKNGNAGNTSSSFPGEMETSTTTISVVVQLRDPLRRYEAVGGPAIVLVNATTITDANPDHNYDDEEKRFKLASLHIGGLRVRTNRGKRNLWDTEKQRLTAMQWLVAYGLGKAAGKKAKHVSSKGQDLLWSISSRVMAGMWLKPVRNPDIKFNK